MGERSIRDAFDLLIERSIPTPSERGAAASHRTSVESCLRNALDVFGLWETGSFHHGTGVRGHSDVDVLVSLKGSRPTDPEVALARVRAALATRFQGTRIRVSRPAVVVDFAGGSERWEVIPAYFSSTTAGHSVYQIPGPAGGWISTAPSAHLEYVTRINKHPVGGAKALARLVKRWKYENPPAMISSFYLEMRAAAHMSSESYFVAPMDFELLMRKLATSELQAMNDPMSVVGRIGATSSISAHSKALARVAGDATLVKRANDAEKNGDRATAFTLLDKVFLGAFPSRFY